MRILALKRVAKTRKLRYERAEAELARLNGTWPRRVYRRGRRAVGLGQLRSFCLFIGYPRSGHSLLGSLLDAHPDIAIAHEVNALGLVVAERPRPADALPHAAPPLGGRRDAHGRAARDRVLVRGSARMAGPGAAAARDRREGRREDQLCVSAATRASWTSSGASSGARCG